MLYLQSRREHKIKRLKDYDVLFTGLGGIDGYTCANRAVFIIKDGSIKYNWEAEPNPGVEPVSYTHLTLPTNREV